MLFHSSFQINNTIVEISQQISQNPETSINYTQNWSLLINDKYDKYAYKYSILIIPSLYQMKIEQAGFKISRTILRFIPKILFKLAILIILMLIVFSILFTFFFKPKFDIQTCLNSYYSQTHLQPPKFAEQLMNQRGINKGEQIIYIHSQQEFDQYKKKKAEQDSQEEKDGDNEPVSIVIDRKLIIDQYLLINSTTHTRIFTSSSLSQSDPCVIQLNYLLKKNADDDTDDETDDNIVDDKQGNIKPEKKIETISQTQKSSIQEIGWIAQSKDNALHFNLSDPNIVQKHNIHIHRIIVPEIQTGFRYLWMDTYVNKIQDFVWGVGNNFKILESNLKEKWIGEYKEKLIEKIEAQKKKDAEEAQKEKQKQTDQNPAGSDHSKEDDQPNKQQQQNQQTDHKEDQPQQKDEEEQNRIKEEQEIKNKEESERMYEEIKANMTFRILNVLSKDNPPFSIYLENQQLKYIPFPNKRSKHIDIISFQENSFVFRLIGYLVIILCLLGSFLLYSGFMGLFVKYSFIFLLGLIEIIEILLFAKKSPKKTGDGFIKSYVYMMLNGHSNNYRLAIQIAITILSIPFLFSCVFYLIIKFICQGGFLSFFHLEPHEQTFFFTIFIIEATHFIFLRSRISLKFFSYLSLAVNTTILFCISKYPFYLSAFWMNMNLLLQLLLVVGFMMIEKLIQEQEFYSEYKPSPSKPRMLFYIGYDLDWQYSIPPLWTTFVDWYDISYLSEKERSLIDQNYELLYGCLLGMDKEQELPEDQDDEESLLKQQSAIQVNKCMMMQE